MIAAIANCGSILVKQSHSIGRRTANRKEIHLPESIINKLLAPMLDGDDLIQLNGVSWDYHNATDTAEQWSLLTQQEFSHKPPASTSVRLHYIACRRKRHQLRLQHDIASAYARAYQRISRTPIDLHTGRFPAGIAIALAVIAKCVWHSDRTLLNLPFCTYGLALILLRRNTIVRLGVVWGLATLALEETFASSLPLPAPLTAIAIAAHDTLLQRLYRGYDLRASLARLHATSASTYRRACLITLPKTQRKICSCADRRFICRASARRMTRRSAGSMSS